MDIQQYVLSKAGEAKEGARRLARATTLQKDEALLKMASLLLQNREELKAANAKDVAAAREKGLSEAMIDRLTLKDKTIDEMANGLREVAAMKDPVGEITHLTKRPNEMMVGKMRVPIGVICMVYESRPNVTADAAGLCIKAGNAALLRGGSEAYESNMAIAALLQEALTACDLPAGAAVFIDNTDRNVIMELIKLEGLVDLVIPRGGEGLIRSVTENSRIPVLKHYKGVCHVFVDRDADAAMAEEICFNAKVQRPGTCNAMETMLVDADIAPVFLPAMVKRFEDAGVELFGCQRSRNLCPQVSEAADGDYYKEYLTLKLNVKIVDNMDEAIGHISTYGSLHTESIVTSNHERAMRFLREVDSSAVMINASTRLNDGGQFGMGAEIGISTDKIHARGPMGLEELTCQKFVVFGNGHLRQ
ncbi:MAG: glutamate-5-semialdehyde dehydrogenase [Nitrospirae bacterium]|nr:glutamate-5-semialdehyde dehydrogenase [Nitrospirota bacterium]